MFSRKNKKMPNEVTLYEGRPSMLLGLRKVIWGVVILALIMYISGPIKAFVNSMQVYAISYIKFGLMGYLSLGIIVLMLLDLIYIIWQLLSWYSIKYVITSERIIVKKGVLNTKTSYMPFKSVQDIDLSQSLIGKLFNIGTVSAFSAYDNNDVKLKAIRDPREVEDIIFRKINEGIYVDDVPQHQIRGKKHNKGRRSKKRFKKPKYSEEYHDEDYYVQKYESQYEEFEQNYPLEDDVIVPNHHENPYYEEKIPKYYDNYDDAYYEEPEYESREYDEYEPKRKYKKYDYEDFPQYEKRKPKYDYEYYNDSLEDNINHAMNNIDSRQFQPGNEYDDDEPYYNDYDYDSMEEFYEENKEEFYIPPEEEEPKDNGKKSYKRDEIVQRHFDKFNR